MVPFGNYDAREAWQEPAEYALLDSKSNIKAFFRLKEYQQIHQFRHSVQK
jgi:hypothetical protein